VSRSLPPNAGVEAKFAASAWGQKLEKRKAKAAMTDFDRYKAMVTKSRRARLVRKTYNQLKKSV
jgi:large subunit ribosomal protein L14e